MNRFAFRMLGEPVAVALLFDFPRFTIGIRPAAVIMPNAFPVSQRGNSTYVIQAKSFVDFNYIKPSGTFRFLDPKMENDILVLDIAHVARTTQTPRLGWRKKKSQSETGAPPS